MSVLGSFLLVYFLLSTQLEFLQLGCYNKLSLGLCIVTKEVLTMNRGVRKLGGEDRKKHFLDLLEMPCLIKKVVSVSLSICRWIKRRERLQGIHVWGTSEGSLQSRGQTVRKTRS